MSILAYGGQTTLIGLLIVFAALIILIFCISLLGKIMAIFTKKPEEKKAAPAPAPAPAPVAAPVVEAAPAAEPAVEEAAEEGEVVTDPQIIAVIAAAIAACDANTKLVIRSVKRASGWKKAARDEAVSRF